MPGKTDLSEDVGSMREMWSNCFWSNDMGGFRLTTPFIGSAASDMESGTRPPAPERSIGLPGSDGARTS